MTQAIVPSGTPASLANLFQENALTRVVGEALRPEAFYREDAVRKELPAGTGSTQSFHRVGLVEVNLKPAPPSGAPEYGQFEIERYTAAPVQYAQSFKISAIQAYGEVGDHVVEVITRASEWAGRTSSRLARGGLLRYLGGFSIIRTAQSSGDSTLRVNSLAGFRFKHVNGVPTAVSSTNKLAVTIVAATTITSLSVTGVSADYADYPDGPGTLTLDSTFGATVAVQSYVYVQGESTTTPRTFIVRAGAKASTEALASNDDPKLSDVIKMKSKLVGRGVPRHEDGTYHLHVDETFVERIWTDEAWRQAFQGVGASPLFGPTSYIMKQHGITVVENNDSPARGRGQEVQVGTASSSYSMKDVGFDVVNSTGVKIRRAVMTGKEVMIESYVDHRKILAKHGARVIHEVGDAAVMDLNGMRFITANIEGWTMMYRPPLDERALESVVTMVNFTDNILPTDLNSGTDTASGAPIKRAVWLEYGSTSLGQ